MRWYAGPQLDEVSCSTPLQETENFKVIDGRVFGFAQPVTNEKYGPTVKLERIIPGCSGSALRGVTVVFVARAPRGGQCVVGWYGHAIVHRTPQKSPLRKHEFYFETAQKDVVLIPEKARTCRVPVGLGAFGKSNLRYTFEKTGQVKTASWTSDVLKYLSTNMRSGVVPVGPIERRDAAA